MKPTMALKPLVFALAAVMAVAVQAGNYEKDRHHYKPKHPTWHEQLSIDSGADAYVGDTQYSMGNTVTNKGTKNTAEASGSMNGSSGNMGANVAAGDGNQQDNVAAIATADEHFIFGSAVAYSTATQESMGNYVKNHSSANKATLSGSGNGASGNLGINVTAGNFNQQKNNLAIAVSAGRVATASATATQNSYGLVVENHADRHIKKDTLKGSFHATGTYKGHGYGVIEDDDYKPGGYHYGYPRKDEDKFTFKEEGTVKLAGYFTKEILIKDGWKNPVVNNATMSGSMNGLSGNGGANVSAGVGNQQSNSLSIAAGCRACSTF